MHMLSKLVLASMRLKIASPNFPDFFRGIITRSATLQKLMKLLQWEGYIKQTYNQASKAAYLHRLVSNYLRSCNKSKNIATYIYNLWKLYENALWDYTLLLFRRRLLRDPLIT